MIFILAYWMIGILLVFTQEEPESREDRSIFIFLLMFIVAAWPIYILVRLIGGKGRV